MTNQQQQVRDWMLAFGQETPEKPCVPSLEVRKLRAKLILEEALETIEALGFTAVQMSSGAWRLGPLIDGTTDANLTEIADGCEDLKVVTEGTLVACGLVEKERKCLTYLDAPIFIDPLFDEVMRSNFSKMWTHKEIKDVEYGDNITSVGDVSMNFHNKFDVIKVKLNLDTPRETTKYILKNKDGKIIKSPSYSPANLQPIIDELSK